MPRTFTDHDNFFRHWEGSYAGRFLVPHPTDLIVDLDVLIVHAPTLSTGEQIFTGCWWNVTQNGPAPWIADPFAKLDQLDDAHLGLVSALIARHVLRRLGVDLSSLDGDTDEGASDQ